MNQKVDVSKPSKKAYWLTNAPEIILAPSRFHLGNVECGGFPLIRDPRGRVIEVITAYFTYIVRWRPNAPGSLKGLAYTLRDWIYFIYSRRLHWSEATDEVVEAWVDAQKRVGIGRTQSDPLGKACLKRKVRQVYDFAIVVEHDLKLVQNFIQNGNDGTASQKVCALNVNMHQRTARDGTKIWAWSPKVNLGRVPKSRVGRPTPSDEDLVKIEDATLSRVGTHALSAHFTIVQLMSDAAPRAAGVAGLDLSDLSLALQNANILDARGPSPRQWDLAGLAGDYDAQQSITGGIERRVIAKYKYIFVRVTEKGSIARDIQVSHSVFLAILRHVWDERALFVERRRQTRPGYSPPDSVFLSSKTGGALTVEAICNLLQNAFKQAKVRGSGHRLRAKAIEDQYVRKVNVKKAIHGKSYSVDDVSFEVSQFAGHGNLASLRSYLNNLIRRDNEIDQPVVGGERRRCRDPTNACRQS